jgi:hypothetical protein
VCWGCLMAMHGEVASLKQGGRQSLARSPQCLHWPAQSSATNTTTSSRTSFSRNESLTFFTSLITRPFSSFNLNRQDQLISSSSIGRHVRSTVICEFLQYCSDISKKYCTIQYLSTPLEWVLPTTVRGRRTNILC